MIFVLIRNYDFVQLYSLLDLAKLSGRQRFVSRRRIFLEKFNHCAEKTPPRGAIVNKNTFKPWLYKATVLKVIEVCAHLTSKLNSMHPKLSIYYCIIISYCLMLLYKLWNRLKVLFLVWIFFRLSNTCRPWISKCVFTDIINFGAKIST